MKINNKKLENVLRNIISDQKKYIDDLHHQKTQLKDELMRN